MKKWVSCFCCMALFVSMLSGMVFPVSGVVSATGETVSLLPTSASAFFTDNGGGGTVTVSADGTGYRFSSTSGWPAAYTVRDASEYVTVNVSDDVYINYDFVVASGGANMEVFFGSSDAYGVSINRIIDPANYVEGYGIIDLPAGTYTGSAHIREFTNILGWTGSQITVTDIKVFAVSGTVTVNDLSVGAKTYTGSWDPPADLTDPVRSTLLPETASSFAGVSAGGGTISVTASGEGFLFSAASGWPYAYTARDASDYEIVDTNKAEYVYYDFEVLSGKTNVVLCFGGQSAGVDFIDEGYYCSLNVVIDPNNYIAGFGVNDLPVGTYKGYVHVKDLGCDAALITDGTFAISDIKVYAVGGNVQVNALEVVRNAEETTTTTTTTTTTATTTTTTTTTTAADVFGERITFTVGNATAASVGDLVEIPVSVSDNHYLVNGRVFVEYDPTVLELQTVCEDEDNPYFESVNAEIFDDSFMTAFAKVGEGQANFAFASSSSTGTATGGVMYTLTFKLLDNPADGTALILTLPEMRSNDGVSNGGADYRTNVQTVDGIVTLGGEFPVKKGDVNLDGEIALADAMQAFYHVNEKIVLEGDSFKAADLDDDGTVTIGEAMKIFYYVNEKITEL